MAQILDSFREQCSHRPDLMLSNLVDSIPYPVVVHDTEYRIVLANRAAADYFGEDLMGHKCYEAERKRHSVCENCPVRQTSEGHESARRELRDPETGDYLQIDTHPMYDAEGDFCGVIETTRPINETAEAIQRLQEMLAETGAKTRELAQFRQSMDFELHIAREIQRSLLPRQGVSRPGIHFEFLYEPSGSIGGDLYDVQKVNDHTTGMLLADASGHGVGAAFIAVMMKDIFRSSDVDYGDPVGVLAEMNGRLTEIIPAGQFATAFYAVYDAASGRLRYSRAGHPLPMVRKRAEGETEMLDTYGFVLGSLEDAELEEQSTMLEPGDRLLFYTDGVIEARNAQEEQFGVERLEEVFSACASAGCEDMMETILDSVRSFVGDTPVTDDITLVTAQVQSL